VTYSKLLGLFLFAVAVIGVLSTPPASAQQKQKLPALLQIPAAIAPNQPSLISRRAALQKEREELRQAFDAQNAQCSAVDQSDTAKIASCTELAQTLSAQLARHIQDSEAFNSAFSKAVSSVGPATPDVYQAALKDCQHLAKLKQLFEKQIVRLNGWRRDSQLYQKESEALRADALRGSYSDALDAIPVEKIAPGILKTKVAQRKLEAIFEAVQGTVSLTAGLSEPDNAEQFKQVAEGEAGIRNGLLKVGFAAKNKAAREWLDNLGSIYGTSIKLSAYALESRNGKIHRLPDRAQLAGEIWGLWNPGVRVAVAGTNLALRGAQAYTAQSVINDIDDVLLKNWNAEFHLQKKIRQLDRFIAEENRIIDSYRSNNPEADSCNVP
jgi:hypothetical protein